MGSFEIVSAAGVVATFVGLVTLAARGGSSRLPWQVPAGLAAGFAAWSAYAVAADGLLGFWPLHTQSPWGVQVFLDLLLMAVVAWFLLLPRLTAAGLTPWPWLVLVMATGSIGMLAALARLLHAESSPSAARPRDGSVPARG